MLGKERGHNILQLSIKTQADLLYNVVSSLFKISKNHICSDIKFSSRNVIRCGIRPSTMGAAEADPPSEARFFVFFFVSSSAITDFESPKATKVCIKLSKENKISEVSSRRIIKAESYDSGTSVLQ